jgi:hypothetical protein
MQMYLLNFNDQVEFGPMYLFLDKFCQFKGAFFYTDYAQIFICTRPKLHRDGKR